MTDCGFYGKLPSEGDFVTRRLPWEFTSVWDAWLQQGMRASLDTLGARWLELYLSAPVWRFQVAPGVCGPRSWRGVFFASVDRVGRYFPLTLAFAGASAAGGPPPAGVASTLAADAARWLAVEDTGLGALDPTRAVDEFDRGVLALAEPAADVPDPGGLAPAAVHFFSLGAQDAPPLRLAFAALPPPSAFVDLILPPQAPSTPLLDALLPGGA